MPSSSTVKRSGGVEGINVVLNSCKTVREKLQGLAKKLRDEEEISGDLSDIKKSLFQRAEKVLELEQYSSILSRRLEELIRSNRETAQNQRRLQSQRNEGSNGANDGEEEVEMEIDPTATKRKIAEISKEADHEVSQLNHAQTKFLMDLKELLDSGEEDDEVVVQRTELSDKDFMCPYTGQEFQRPMSNNNSGSNCKHHLDEQALENLLKKNLSIRCPVAGCSGMWRRNAYEHDSRFQRKMERYKQQRLQNPSQGEEYTAV